MGGGTGLENGCEDLGGADNEDDVYETIEGKVTINHTKRECFKVEFTFFYESVNIFLSVLSTFSQEALTILADD